MRHTRPATTRLAAVLAAVLGVAAIALALPAGAGTATTASVTTDCRSDEGYIHVTIEGIQQSSYDIFIEGNLVGDAVTIGVHNYGPFADGSYNVVVVWFPDGEQTLLDDDVEIACAPTTTSTTTTVPPTTATTIPATTTTAPPQPAAPVPATPTFTG